MFKRWGQEQRRSEEVLPFYFSNGSVSYRVIEREFEFPQRYRWGDVDFVLMEGPTGRFYREEVKSVRSTTDIRATLRHLGVVGSSTGRNQGPIYYALARLAAGTERHLQLRIEDTLRDQLPEYLANVAAGVKRTYEIEQAEWDIVRVRFPGSTSGHVGGGGNTWAYRCSGAKVGDIVIVPPTPYCETEQYVPVVALGRGGYKGPVKTARLAQPPMRLVQPGSEATPCDNTEMRGYGGCPEPESRRGNSWTV